MANVQKPLTGGSYIRNKDGSLKRTGGTEAAKPAAPAAAPPADPPAGNDPASAAPDTSKKGK